MVKKIPIPISDLGKPSQSLSIKINEVIDSLEVLATDVAKTNVEVTKMVNIIANITNNPTLVEDDYKLPGVDNLGDPGTAVDAHKKKQKPPKENPFD